jgi:hypothetical protein
MNEHERINPRFGFNKVGLPIIEKIRTHVVEGAAFDHMDASGRPRFKAVPTIVRVVRF